MGKNRPHDLIYYKGGFIIMVFIIRVNRLYRKIFTHSKIWSANVSDHPPDVTQGNILPIDVERLAKRQEATIPSAENPIPSINCSDADFL